MDIWLTINLESFSLCAGGCMQEPVYYKGGLLDSEVTPKPPKEEKEKAKKKKKPTKRTGFYFQGF